MVTELLLKRMRWSRQAGMLKLYTSVIGLSFANTLLKALSAIFIAGVLTVEGYAEYYYFILLHQATLAFKEYGYTEFYLKEKTYTARNEQAINTIELLRITLSYLFLLTFFDLARSEVIVLAIIYISDILQPKSLVKLLRNKKNDVLFKIEFLSSLSMLCCFICLDFLDVHQKLFAYSAYHAVRTCMLRKTLRLRYAATLSKEDINFFSDGKWVLFSALIFLALNRVDKILIEPFISLSILGGYLFISNFFNVAFQVVIKSVKPIIDRQIAFDRRAFPKIYTIYSSVVLLAAGFFAYLTDDLLNFIFDDKWQSFYWMINYIIVICLFNNLKIWGLFYSTSLFRYRFWVDLSQVVCFFLGLSAVLFFEKFSLTLLLSVQVVAGLLSYFLWVYLSCRVYDYSPDNNI